MISPGSFNFYILWPSSGNCVEPGDHTRLLWLSQGFKAAPLNLGNTHSVS